MQLQVSGRNLDVTEPIREYAERKLARIERHLTEDTRVDLELAIERNRSISANQYAELTVWTRGPVLRAHEYARGHVRGHRPRGRQAGPPGAALPRAAAPLAAPSPGARHRGAAAALRRRRGRLRRPTPTASEPELPIPTIVKTKRFNMKPMHPDEAALQLELVGHEFYVFLNAESDAVAVIYRRRDGNLGVIEPVPG